VGLTISCNISIENVAISSSRSLQLIKTPSPLEYVRMLILGSEGFRGSFVLSRGASAFFRAVRK
jgi:hypothetical protein